MFCLASWYCVKYVVERLAAMLVLQGHTNLPAVATLQKLANELPTGFSLLNSVYSVLKTFFGGSATSTPAATRPSSPQPDPMLPLLMAPPPSSPPADAPPYSSPPPPMLLVFLRPRRQACMQNAWLQSWDLCLSSRTSWQPSFLSCCTLQP